MKLRIKDMESMLKENGSSSSTTTTTVTSKSAPSSASPSVIHVSQQSVIQTSGNVQPTVLTKGNVILVTKPNSSVVHTPEGNVQTLHVVCDSSRSGKEGGVSPRERRTKRHTLDVPSSIKLEDSVSNEMITKLESSGSDCDSNLDSELSSHSLSISNHYQSILPTSDSLQLSNHNDDSSGMTSVTMTTAGGSNNPSPSILHYSGQDNQYYVPSEIVVMSNSPAENNANLSPEDQVKKRELRLLKNREAARECRRKKKEYIKCLENRVAVLETQNKALIEELKSLKELYCLQKGE